MNQITCEIVQDLLSLYYDDVCSTESKAAVVSHLETCDKCRKAFSVLQSPIEYPESRTERDAAEAASKAWKNTRKKAFRFGVILVTALLTLFAAGFAGLHFLQSSTQNDTVGLIAQLQKWDGCETVYASESVQKGDILAMSCYDDNGYWYLGIYHRDTVFSDRWVLYGCLDRVKSGKLASWNYQTPGGDSILVCFGASLSDEITGYTFTNNRIIYTCPIANHAILDIFFVTGSYDAKTHLEPIYADRG